MTAPGFVLVMVWQSVTVITVGRTAILEEVILQLSTENIYVGAFRVVGWRASTQGQALSFGMLQALGIAWAWSWSPGDRIEREIIWGWGL